MGSRAVGAAVFLTCQDCKITKPEDQYHKHSGKINGRRSACKDCSNTAHRQRNARRTGQPIPAPLPPLPNNTPSAVWTSPTIRGDLPGIWGSDLVHYKGKIYTCGGYGDERAALVRIDTSSRRAGSVRSSGEAPASLDSHSVTPFGDSLIVFGGIDSNGGKRNSVHMCDLKEMHWQRLSTEPDSAAPTARESHSAVLDQQRQQLLIFGGNSAADGEAEAGSDVGSGSDIDHNIKYLNDLWALHLESSTWQRIESCAQVPIARDSHSAVLLEGRMIVFGGDRGGGQYLSDTWAYDIASNEWTQLRVCSPWTPVARAGHAAGVCGGSPGGGGSECMLMFGGVGADGDTYFNDVWLLTVGPIPEQGLGPYDAWWSRVLSRGPEPSGRFAQAASVEGNQLFVVGGCNAEARPLNDVHILTVALPLPPLASSVSAAAKLPAGPRSAPSRVHSAAPHLPAQTPGIGSGGKAEAFGAGRRIRRGLEQYTSFDIFCEQLREPLRSTYQNITKGDLQRRMTQQWADISEADKAQCALEAAARNQAACQAKPSTTAVLDSVSDEGERVSYPVREDNRNKKRRRDRQQQQPSKVMRTKTPLGASVSGAVNGMFDGGLLATVTVMGQQWRAVLFNPDTSAMYGGGAVQGNGMLGQLRLEEAATDASLHYDGAANGDLVDASDVDMLARAASLMKEED